MIDGFPRVIEDGYLTVGPMDVLLGCIGLLRVADGRFVRWQVAA